MLLPGRLRATSTGDLLGALHRARASGILELTEEPQERTHRVHFTGGLVTWVEVDRASASLAEILREDESFDDDLLRRSLLRAMAGKRLHGEVLVQEFRVPEAVVARALRTQLRQRLALLERLSDARVSFHVSLRRCASALAREPLDPREFLHGRSRARECVGKPKPSCTNNPRTT